MTPSNAKSPSATSRDVARLAGVSVAPVRRYRNQTAIVSEETAARLQATMAELKYIPQAAVRRRLQSGVDLDAISTGDDEAAWKKPANRSRRRSWNYYGTTIYDNGIPTLRAKTELALQHASGLMIGTLQDDAQDETVLLNAI